MSAPSKENQVLEEIEESNNLRSFHHKNDNIFEHRNKRVKSDQPIHTVIIDQSLFADLNSGIQSTNAIGNCPNSFNI